MRGYHLYNGSKVYTVSIYIPHQAASMNVHEYRIGSAIAGISAGVHIQIQAVLVAVP
jgi:hypothetical protein